MGDQRESMLKLLVIKNKKRGCFRIFISIILLFTTFSLANAHITSEDTYVRVVSANPETRTYTFRCFPNPELGHVRDWFIYGEKVGSNEMQFLDVPANQDITHTFQTDNYYHIGCLIVDPKNGSHLLRGDIHIDLRKRLFDGEVLPLDVISTNKINLNCTYTPNPYTVQWWVSTYWGAASEPTKRTSLNTSQKRTDYTSPGHGLYHPRCNIFDSLTGQMHEAGIPLEFFDDKGPYVADRFGIDLNGNFHTFNFDAWISMFNGTNQTPPSCLPSNETCDSKDNDCDGQIDEGDVCISAPPSSCANKVNGMPASCTGGTITQDTKSGCRTLACTGGSNSIQVLACDKPSSSNAQHFEVYRQTFTGIPPKICLGETCVQNNGFAQSPNFPICFNSTSNSTNATLPPANASNNTNVTLPPPNANETNPSPPSNLTCFKRISELPVNCTGIIISDIIKGCRKLICKNGANNITVQGCDKPGSSNAQYFELYKQAQSGTPPQVCFANVCIQNLGYFQSQNYPICIANKTATSNISNGTTDTPTNITNATSTTCYQNFRDIPADCDGTITSDITASTGCREITCSNGQNSLKAQACNKPDNSAPQFFDMYKQSSTGTPPLICLGSTCIKENGFAQSPNFPICINTTMQGNNSPPLAPQWLEPPQNAVNIDPVDFHIHVFDMDDPDGDGHIATDFEIWDGISNERVWTLHTTNLALLTHVHSADGTFEGNLAGMNQLLEEHQYIVRARFYSDSPANNVGAWSVWQFFKTKPPSNITGTSVLWTPSGSFDIQLVASGIKVPVNIAFAPNLYAHLPDAQQPLLYVTQLYGQIGMIRKDSTYVGYADNILNYESCGSLPGSGETGVDGIYADPMTGDLFVSMVYTDNQSSTGYFGKVVRFMTNDDGNGFTNNITILSKIPTAPSHHVHTITRGPDGKLYLTTGDGHNLNSAKNTDALSGKVLRFNEDGSVPADNPIAGKYFYAGGFRNPFGAAWRPGTSDLFVSNNGPNDFDGVYRVKKGDIYGWCCDTAVGTWHSWPQITAPVQVAFNYGTSGFPGNMTGSMFVGLSGPTYKQGPDPLGKRIARFAFNPDGSKQSIEDFVTYTGSGYGTPIGIAFGTDGLYFTDIFGEQGFIGACETRGNIYKVVAGSGKGYSVNTTLQFSSIIRPKQWYPKGLEIVWECIPSGGSGNFTYDFDYGDGEKSFNQKSDNAYHLYQAAGAYTASCTVRDAVTGKSTIGTTTINLEECRPGDFQCN